MFVHYPSFDYLFFLSNIFITRQLIYTEYFVLSYSIDVLTNRYLVYMLHL